MDIRSKEDALFARWKMKKEYLTKTFVVDGAPFPDSFEDSKARCLIVLKDVNFDSKDPYTEVFDLRKQLANKPHNWWWTVANWCAGISGIHEEKAFTWAELVEHHKTDINIRDSLKPFAFMQLKKATGGGSVGANALADHVGFDKEEIREQIRIYQPAAIICCGVGNLVNTILGNSAWSGATQRGVQYAMAEIDGQRTVVIDYMHPSARAAKNIVCYGILDAYRELVMPDPAT